MDTDQAEVWRLHKAWNDAYVRQERTRLADVLADDFTGLTPNRQPITKATLMEQHPPVEIRLIRFTEEEVRMFGQTGVTRGRFELEFDNTRIDQRFIRIFAKRDGIWRAVSVAVSPVPSN